MSGNFHVKSFHYNVFGGARGGGAMDAMGMKWRRWGVVTDGFEKKECEATEVVEKWLPN